VLLQLSKAYRRVATLEGSPFVANLGNFDNAISSFQKALEMALLAHERWPGEETTTAVIIGYHELGEIETFAGDLEKARDHYQRCLALASQFLREKSGEPLRKQLLAAGYTGLACVQLSNLETDKAAEAIAFYEKTIPIAEDLARRFPSNQNKRLVWVLYNNMAAFLAGTEMLNVGEPDKAQVYVRKVSRLQRNWRRRTPRTPWRVLTWRMRLRGWVILYRQLDRPRPRAGTENRSS
jgi:serine/threonine-protein kinase